MNVTVPDPEDIGKVFVGGLSIQTTKETLYNYFSQFGEVVDSVVMKNSETGRSRGFGFVTFKDPSCVYEVLQVKDHDLDGKKIDPKECTPRSMQRNRKQAGKCKVFLGGLTPDITVEAIQIGMSKFGKVNQVLIMSDPETKKCRGFGFLSFELEESIEQACAQRFVIINGKQIECKRAEPRVNPKLFAPTRGFSKNQDGYIKHPSFGQITSTNRSNWSMASQPSYNMQGNSYTQGYQNNGNSAVVHSSMSASFDNLSPMAYAQFYQQNYASAMGNYSYPSVPLPTFTQPAYVSSSHTVGTTAASAAGKSYGSNDYSQNPSSYVPSKIPCEGTDAPEAAFLNQSTPYASYQRFHPYKA